MAWSVSTAASKYRMRHCRSVQTSRTPKLTVQNTLWTPRKVPFEHACTTRRRLYKSAITSLYRCSPCLMGESTNAATVDVSQARSTTAHLTSTTKEQFTYCKTLDFSEGKKASRKGSAEIPTAVEEPASSHTSTLRNVSVSASA